MINSIKPVWKFQFFFLYLVLKAPFTIAELAFILFSKSTRSNAKRTAAILPLIQEFDIWKHRVLASLTFYLLYRWGLDISLVAVIFDRYLLCLDTCRTDAMHMIFR